MKKLINMYNVCIKAELALEGIKEQKILQELAEQNKIQSMQLSECTVDVMERPFKAFEKDSCVENFKEQELDMLYKKVEQLNSELDWLKKCCRERTYFEPPIWK